jgi:hypothetical protein
LDGVVFLEDDDGTVDFLPIEIKSRVSAATMTEAADRVEEYIGAEA